MLQSIFQLLAYFARRLIVRVSLYAMAALVSVGAALVISPYLPASWVTYLGAGALETVLTTLASSMLAVTTFSLSILSSAFRAAEGSATPRAVLILREDQTTHKILSVFIGAFLFALTGIILLATPLMSNATRFVLFLFTIAMVVQVVIAMIRWINHIEKLGSLDNMLDNLQAKTRPVMKRYSKSQTFGAHPLNFEDEDRGEEGRCIKSRREGYVTMIAFDALQEQARNCDARIFIQVGVGQYVRRGDTLMRVDSLSKLSPVVVTLLENSVRLASLRSFDQDPVFGVTVMTEIANRALSSGVNDPQTAVDVVNRVGSVLLMAGAQQEAEEEIEFDRLWLAPVPIEALFRSSLDVIARSGGDLPEVAEAMQKALADIVERGSPLAQAAARACAGRIGVVV